ncbi:MAG: hypothetical protein ACI9K5_002894 [Gammaproteobacteria bacterium]|jgi:hypothetical protein
MASVFAALVPGLFLGGCSNPQGDEPATLGLLGFSQADGRGVRLNETLRFQFSQSVDRASITGSSFAVEGPNGEPVRGTVQQRASTLQFVPDLPLRDDLIDGGLLPGRTYTVRLLGFPAPDGIRGVGGEPLSQSFVFHFKTAGAGGDDAVFVPPISGELPLFFDCKQQLLEPLDEIRLEAVEGLDPRSIHNGVFELYAAEASSDTEAIPLRAQLRQNRSDYSEVVLQRIADLKYPDTLLALEPGEYYLWQVPHSEPFVTLGSLPVTPVWIASGETVLKLRVVAAKVESEREEFDTLSSASPILADGVDGRAYFDGGGEVRVRFPAAAGSGEAGSIADLSRVLMDIGAEERVDLHATGMLLPKGPLIDLSDRVGPVILRAQRGMRINGILRRRQSTTNLAPGSSLEDWIRPRSFELTRALQALEVHQGAVARGDLPEEQASATTMALEARLASARDALTLTRFLGEALAAEVPWTILVAGGDVVVDGEIDVDGELLIIAGGWIRVGGRVSAGEVWATPGGGGDFGVLHDVPHEVPLVLDEPLENPLREELRVAIVSRSIRPQGGVEEWLGLKISADEGAGQARVSVIGERQLGPRSKEKLGPVDSLNLLKGWTSLRLVVELVIPPGPGPWDPPRLDAVEVTWKAPEGAGERQARARAPRNE